MHNGQLKDGTLLFGPTKNLPQDLGPYVTVKIGNESWHVAYCQLGLDKEQTLAYHDEVTTFILRISRVAHVARVFTLVVLDRRPLLQSAVMQSFSTSGSIAVPNAVHRSL